MAQRANNSKQSRGRKNRKHGREGRHPSNVRYVAEKRWNKHKATSIRKHLRKHPNDYPKGISLEVEVLI